MKKKEWLKSPLRESYHDATLFCSQSLIGHATTNSNAKSIPMKG
jgi:hypothetical protein